MSSKHLIAFSLLGAFIFGISHSACARCARSAESETDYYQSANQKKGRELKMALGQIAQQHTVFSYNELWYRYEVTDVMPGTENQVFDYYSPVVHYFTGTGAAASGMNKEHACPQSWWGSGAQCAAYSDLFNVMPSEEGANSAKSNFPVGTVGSIQYSNDHMKTGPSSRSEYDGSVFEPCNDFKGDFARIYFYVATTYANAAWGSKTSVAKTCPFSTEDYPTIKSWLLPLLLQWNAQDPVSEWEVTRNERVFNEQGNRNPFIDYPQLADYIWGDSTEFAFDFSRAVLHGIASGQMADGLYHGDNPGTNPGDDTPIVPSGDDFLFEDFSSVTDGNSTSSSGSSSAWSGNDNFPYASSAYQAGGAVKLGSSKVAGILESRAMANTQDITLQVDLDVKGWTSVEGTLQVGITGCGTQTVTYTHTMTDGFEHVTLIFEHCPANAQLKISTSAKRAFVDNIRVTSGASQTISAVRLNSTASAMSYTLQGHKAPNDYRGIAIQQGRVFIR